MEYRNGVDENEHAVDIYVQAIINEGIEITPEFVGELLESGLVSLWDVEHIVMRYEEVTSQYEDLEVNERLIQPYDVL